jgi:hypothetical protein
MCHHCCGGILDGGVTFVVKYGQLSTNDYVLVTAKCLPTPVIVAEADVLSLQKHHIEFSDESHFFEDIFCTEITNFSC